MCVMSMVMDYYGDKWRQQYVSQVGQPAVQIPSQQEIQEFRDLLERARKYDREHHEPDCELAEKKQLLLDLAKRFGIDISFIEQPAQETPTGRDGHV